MANFNLYFPIEEQEEGTAYENVPGDKGGCTKFGLTLDDLNEYHLDKEVGRELTCEDVKSLTAAEAALILKKLYWDYFKADEIDEQSVAEYIVDAGLNQGRVLIVKYLQHMLGVAIDGVYGPTTFKFLQAAILKDKGLAEYNYLYAQRLARYKSIVAANPSQQKFYNGWLNRLNNIKYS